MGKMSKSFRLSQEALDAIEQRDLKKYPTATEFLEEKILVPPDSVRELLSKISQELEEVKALLNEKEELNSKERDPFLL